MRRRRGRSGLAFVAALVGAFASVAPVAATTPLVGETMYWKADQAGIKGLITVTFDAGLNTISWNLWGLRAGGNYALAGFGETCADDTPSGSLFLVDFTANAKGFSWDPVTVAGTLSTTGSVRIRDLDAGEPVVCLDSASIDTGGPSPSIGTIKLKAPGVRGLAVIDETSSGRTVLAITGLRASTRHRIVLRSAGCTGGTVLRTDAFTSSGTGRALVDRRVFEPAGGITGELTAGSLRVKRGTTSVVCGVPTNRAS